MVVASMAPASERFLSLELAVAMLPIMIMSKWCLSTLIPTVGTSMSSATMVVSVVQ